jgi:hypothetical protein
MTELMDIGVEFVAIDNPHANKSMVRNLVAAARRDASGRWLRKSAYRHFFAAVQNVCLWHYPAISI